MQILNLNNVKIYNLSAGKSLPEWITAKKAKKLQRDDPDLQRRVEPLQGFEMPTLSNCVQVSPDNQYIFATGVYKPRVKVYDTSQMSLKFERCVDAEIVKLHILSEDYSKFVLMMNDRFIEYHIKEGRYFRMRIPNYGRDMAYCKSNNDMYFVGVSPMIYRFNLEQGRFMSPLKTQASEINCCEFSNNELLACGTKEGKVEYWDPRAPKMAGFIDCAKGIPAENFTASVVPSITSLKFRDTLNLAAGTSTGQILLYDIRSEKPLLVKDHKYDLPIKALHFHKNLDLVMSIDSKILKMWNRETGKPFTAIEPPDTLLNDLCVIPNSGMVLMANEAPKMQLYYIPDLGPAPKWCHYLDSITEELEETNTSKVYDDYKFITRSELENIGLAHLIGSKLLRGYMHGYFIDSRLYHKAKNIAEPVDYEEYKKVKIREKVQEERQSLIKVKKLPKINRDLAESLTHSAETDAKTKATIKKKKEASAVLNDNRFASLFKNPDFQIDMESEEYTLVRPIMSGEDKKLEKKTARQLEEVQKEDEEEEAEGRPSSEEGDSDDSSDDEQHWTKEMKDMYRQGMYERRQQERAARQEEALMAKPKVYELKESQHSFGEQTDGKKIKKRAKLTLGERVDAEGDSGMIQRSGSVRGNLEMTFTLKKNPTDIKRKQEMAEHRQERKKIRRSAGNLSTGKKDPRMFSSFRR